MGQQSDSLREAMRLLSGGVSVITVGSGDDCTGATVTSATALSIDPPIMIVNINLSSSTWHAIRCHRHFCVNILGRQHTGVANRFAGRGGIKGRDRYHGARWESLATGAPVLVGALAAIDCQLEEAIERHSHAIVLGRVSAIAVNKGEGLVYADRQYGSFVPEGSDSLSTRFIQSHAIVAEG